MAPQNLRTPPLHSMQMFHIEPPTSSPKTSVSSVGFTYEYFHELQLPGFSRTAQKEQCVSGSRPNFPLSSITATNQGYLGLAPQLAPLQEGQGSKAKTGASLHQHLFLFMASSRQQNWSITAQVLYINSLEQIKYVKIYPNRLHNETFNLTFQITFFIMIQTFNQSTNGLVRRGEKNLRQMERGLTLPKRN